MDSRNFKHYFWISLKGIAMGAADAVPGVSGGTIAFISGIYEELVSTISSIDFSLVTTLRKRGLKAFWTQLNGNFLVALLSGILISFVSFMRLAKYLIENQPILIWSFFFGLIIASVIYVGKEIKQWRAVTLLSIIMGALVAFYITTLPSLGSNENSIFLFFAGALAICAMILPGISGSFILVVLGAYKTLSDAIHDLNIQRIAIFASGATIGLLSFSRLLKWLFKHYENTTLALLTGFIIGSLNKIWPWKETLSVYAKEGGAIVPMYEVTSLGTLSVFQKQQGNFDLYKTVTEQSVSPWQFSEINGGMDPQLWLSILFTALGFVTIFLLEQTAKLKNSKR